MDDTQTGEHGVKVNMELLPDLMKHRGRLGVLCVKFPQCGVNTGHSCLQPTRSSWTPAEQRAGEKRACQLV